MEPSDRTPGQRFHLALAAAVYAPFLVFLALWHSAFSTRIIAEDGITFMGEARDALAFGALNTKVAFPMQLRGKPEQTPPFTLRAPYNKPLYPVIEAGVFAIFGASVKTALWTCVSFYLLTGALLYLTVLDRWGPAGAHAAAIAYLTSFKTLFFSTTNHADIPFAFFMAASAFVTLLGEKRHRWVGGALAGAAALTRPGGILMAFLLSLAALAIEHLDKDPLGVRLRRTAMYLAATCVPVAVILGLNYTYHGSPFSYYDMKGLEFSGARQMLNYSFYQPELYAPPGGAVQTSGQPGALNIVWDTLVSSIKGLWAREPFALAFLLPAVLWPPLWLRHRMAGLTVAVGAAAMGMQLVIGKGLAGHVKEFLWLYPFLCLAVGVMAGDLWRALAAESVSRLRAAAIAPLLAVFLSGALGSTVSYLRFSSAPDGLEAVYQQKDWKTEADRLAPVIPADGLLIGEPPLHYLFGAWLEVYSLMEPAEFSGLLGSLNKLRTSHVYHAVNKAPDVFHPREGDCAYTAFPQAAPYATLFFSNRFLCVYQLDADGIRRDFAPDIARLPY